MAWFRLEGRGAFHHKVLAAGNEAYGAWCRAGQWSSDQLTDGLVPRAVAEQIAKSKVWTKLVEARLIHEAEGGYQIHDFLDWNPSSDQERARREETREKRREAGRVGGKRSGEVRRAEADGKQTGSNGEANAKQSASGVLEANAKQNEAPSPSPSPSPIPEEEQQTHTLRGRAGTYDQDEAMPTPCGVQDFEDLLRSFDAIGDLADDPDLVTDLHSGFAMAHMGAATLDLARGAMADVVSQKSLRDASPSQRRELVAKYLRHARRPRAERTSEPQSPAVRIVLDVFAAAWTTRKKRQFVQADGDEKHAAKLVELAREHAESLGVLPRVIVKHWAEGYLRDGEKFVADPEHPLRLLPGRITGYGLPRSGTATALATPTAPSQPAPVGPPPDLAATLAKVGTSPGGGPVQRPRFGAAS